MTKKYILMVLCCFLFVGGCCKPPRELLIKEDPSFVAVQLSQAAEYALADLHMLAMLKGKGMLPLLPAPSSELEKPITFSWSGVASDALKKICLEVRYKFREIGSVPALPITVVIRGTNRQVYDILEDIAWQIYPRAVLRVDPVGKVLTVAFGE